MTTSSSSRRRKLVALLGKIMLIPLGIIFALLLAEGVAQILGPPYDVSNEVLRLHQCDSQVGWRGVANGSNVIDWYGHEHQFTLNARGLHDDDHALRKEDDVFRILMLGDSMLAAVEAAGAKTAFFISPINEAVAVDVNPDRRAAMVASLPVLDQADPTLPHKIFSELMSRRGMTVFDLHPGFVSHVQQTGQSLHWSDANSHWNVEGNRVAGKLLANWLIDNQLVPLEAK